MLCRRVHVLRSESAFQYADVCGDVERSDRIGFEGGYRMVVGAHYVDGDKQRVMVTFTDPKDLVDASVGTTE